MTLSRRAFFASLAASSGAAVAHAQTREAPVDEGLFQLAGRCILAGSRAPQLHPTLAQMLERNALGGVLVAGENARTSASLRALVDGVRVRTPAGDPPVLIAADQEGGTVSHLSPVLPRMPSVHELGAIDDTALTTRWGAAMGADLRRVGVNFDLAPVLDVRTNPRNMVVHMRTFGERVDVVTRHARPVLEGLLGAGVLACVKHFPGHGDTAVDSHYGLPRVAHTMARLDAVELVPFRAVMNLTPAVMLAHVVYAGVDAERPASLSRAIAHGLLRERMNFTGAAVTDDLEMSAIRSHWGVSAGAVMAMEAGCDLLTIAHSPHIAMETARIMARRASQNRAFRTRLEEAAGRVHALRTQLTRPVPSNAVQATVWDVLREVGHLTRARDRRAARNAVDPTRAAPR